MLGNNGSMFKIANSTINWIGGAWVQMALTYSALWAIAAGGGITNEG